MTTKATRYTGNKTFEIVDAPVTAPEPGEVRIKVAYCGVCGTDVHIYHGMMDQRVSIPLTIGHEMSGTVDAVGEGVTGFSVGEKVVVRPLDDRGAKPSDKGHNHIASALKFIGIDSPGAMQPYWNVPAFTLHKLPDTSDLRLAALIEPLAVACHDVRLSGLKENEYAVVLGGGPIGMLVAMRARSAGAKVLISETNETRVAMAKELGFAVVNPAKENLVDYVSAQTDGGLADVVFEVAGVQPTIDVMTDVAGIRGRIVLVAIHGQPRPVNLFKFFWKELQLIGARVYEPEDYEDAIRLVAEKSLPLESLITAVAPLTEVQSVFEQIDRDPNGMKVLLDCQA
ncbi:2-desacetyl-2-hydroxyethyl bacteriochlorophyllide A dehydrogenase [Lewinella aquimaris]|uniref:2-desacetyl-2-hydroxyethyl bacteriochlorophyllide A dehydrogenase n=1 Tax=Neolewinella aquimaris TaxID=1835722 RepID=A0A840E9Y0_9BACT|nr:alcohol dehydrogenase catalytic domain-containing protein [Neolewinella aquimaris]MBB4080532.1 2-desacetyl-2-hydroxyethyl bacteriochlorophyllide A dehydrogenase [Neolewinella aquimaris]